MAESSEAKTTVKSPQIQETFSYAWYPTQCEIGQSTIVDSNSSLRGNNNTDKAEKSYRVFKSEDNGEEMIVVEQAAPSQVRPILPPPSLGPRKVIGSKFTEQQSRTLMVTWKEHYDIRRYPPTGEADWRHITNKVNMAPGSYKTMKQVKKKFKNLRDRYRAAKAKNKRKGLGLGKTHAVYYAEFEQVFGNEDNPPIPRQLKAGSSKETTEVNSQIATSAATMLSPFQKVSRSMEQANTSTVPPEPPNTYIVNMQAKPLQEHAASSTKQHTSGGSPQICQDNRRISGGTSDQHVYEAMPSGSDVIWPSVPPKEDTQSHSQLINAVRELQKQQITMQREISRNMKQMEERILSEVSTRIREGEDRFRQQIANALTQLGNLIRIT